MTCGRWSLASAAGALIALAVGAGCGDDGLDYTGALGVAVAADYDGWVPSVAAAAVEPDTGAAAAGRFLVDTGSPFTIIDSDATALADGVHRLDLDAFDLGFPDYRTVVFDAFPYGQIGEPRIGIIGGDLLRFFAVTFDYAGNHVWLRESLDGGALPPGLDATAVAAPDHVPFARRGGGRVYVPGECDGGCGTTEIPATRVLVELGLEDRAEPVWALVDTGASSVLLDESLLAELGDDANRPRLDGVTVGTANGTVTAYFSRVSQMVIGGSGVASAVVLVIPGTELFTAVSDEVGRDVRALVGGTFLRNHVVSVDYVAEELVIARYIAPTHIDENEYIDPGFTLYADGNQWRIGDVYANTHAASVGLRRGEPVVELDGVSVTGAGEPAVRSIVDGLDLGDELDVGLLRAGAVTTVAVRIEDLLPAYDGGQP